MCRRVECSRCGRPTYAGCGAHVEQVLSSVPPAERCRCREMAGRTTDLGVAVDDGAAALRDPALGHEIFVGALTRRLE